METRWPFYNPEQPLTPGVWYWQFGYVEDGQVTWGSTQQVTVEDRPGKFCPPSFENSVGKTTSRPSACVDHEERMEGLYKSQQTKGRKTMVS